MKLKLTGFCMGPLVSGGGIYRDVQGPASSGIKEGHYRALVALSHTMTEVEYHSHSYIR